MLGRGWAGGAGEGVVVGYGDDSALTVVSEW
jgi:hypothetical protein